MLFEDKENRYCAGRYVGGTARKEKLPARNRSAAATFCSIMEEKGKAANHAGK